MYNQKAMFQEYTINQLVFPLDYSELIPNHHIARVVNDMVEAVDDELFEQVYAGGGRPAYHPKMMTKIVLYGYTQKLYSCRDIAKAVCEYLPMMWLASMQTPDFRTINRFRSERLQPLMDTLFREMTRMLIEEGYVDMASYFLDGTKMEANANKYTFVWKKSTQNYEEKLQQKIEETLATIHHAIDQDTQSLRTEDETFGRERIQAATLQQIAAKVKQELKKQEQELEQITDVGEKKTKKAAIQTLKKQTRPIENDYLPRLRKYEKQMNILGERNSYSKTDPDATFMRMKDDAMKNGQLKAGYNWQIGTQNQFILGYSVHPNPTDTRCLKPHVEQLQTRNLPLPQWLVADAGYGSETNYLYMTEETDITSLMPYGTHRLEQKRSFAKNTHHVANWMYVEDGDFYWCPNQRKVVFQRYSKRTDSYGYTRDFKIYECESCEGCPLKTDCTKAKGNRQIHYNPVFEELKAKEYAKLHSNEGKTLYQQRKIDVESVFGHVKQNMGFRRLHLRGMEKVTIELGWIALAHNIRKRVAVDFHSQQKNHFHPKNRRDYACFHNGFSFCYSFFRAFGTAPYRDRTEHQVQAGDVQEVLAKRCCSVCQLCTAKCHR